MSICIPPQTAQKLKDAIKAGEVSVENIKTFDSATRSDTFSKYLGKDLGTKLARGVEQRMGSKTEKIIEEYIERELNRVPVESKKSILVRAKKAGNLLNPEEGQPFLRELAGSKMGTQLTQEQAQTVFRLTTDAEAAQSRLAKEFFEATGKNIDEMDDLDKAWKEKRTDAFLEEVKLDDYFSEIKRTNTGWSRYKTDTGIEIRKGNVSGIITEGSKLIGATFVEALGSVKSAVASLDNSFFGRQGLKFFSHSPKQWATNFAKSFGDIAKGASGKRKGGEFSLGEIESGAYNRVRAEILSRKNARNGKYNRAGNSYGLRVASEEAFPVAFPERIPILGRAFKGAETAFNSAALRMRADLADALIAKMEKEGVDMMKKDNADALGDFVSSFTGRGTFGKHDVSLDFWNKVLFSPRFFKSQLDTFTAIPYALVDPSNPIKRLAAQKTAMYMFETVALLGFLDLIGVAEVNPRSKDFGTINIGDYKFDLTGGIKSIVVLANKILLHESYDPRTGTFKSTDTFGYTTKDAFYGFMENKMAPVASVGFKALFDGELFGGKPMTAGNIAQELLIPITANEVYESFFVRGDDVPMGIAILIGEGLGFSASDIRFNPSGKDWKALRNVNEKLYYRAVKDLWTEMGTIRAKYKKNSSYQKLDKEEQSKVMEKEVEEAKKNAMRKYEKFLPKD